MMEVCDDGVAKRRRRERRGNRMYNRLSMCIHGEIRWLVCFSSETRESEVFK
jgi:hypothetical protein